MLFKEIYFKHKQFIIFNYQKSRGGVRAVLSLLLREEKLKNTGQIQGKNRAITGQKQGKYRANTGQILGKYWGK